MKRVIVCLLAILSVFVFSACKKGTLTAYEVYCLSDAHDGIGDIYNAAEYTYKWEEKTPPQKKLAFDKRFSIGDLKLKLEYQRSYQDPLCDYVIDEYQNEETFTEVSFRRDTGRVASILMSPCEYSVCDKATLDNEEELIRVCRDFAAQFMDGTEAYSPSVTSRVQMGNLGSGQLSEVMEAMRHLYKVEFNRMYEGFITADYFEVNLYGDGSLSALSIHNTDAFRKEKTTIDKAACEAALDRTVRAICETDRCSLASYTKEGMLVYENRQLCVFYTVRPDLAWKEEGMHASCPPLSFLVPVN